MLKNLQNLMLVTLLALAAQQVSCADQKAVSVAQRVWDGAKGMATWTGDQAEAIANSSFYWRLRYTCEAIAGYTIFETIKKVGIRSTARMLTAKPMVFPVACYGLAPLVSIMCDKMYEQINSKIGFVGTPGLSEEARHKEFSDFYDSKMAKLGTLNTCKKYLNVLPLASVLYFLTLAQPLSVSVAAKTLV